MAKDHAAAGSTSVVSGRNFEAELKAMHDRWRRLRWASIQKGNPSVIRIGKRFQVTGKGGVDWTGVYRGVAVAYESKVRSGKPRLELVDRKGRDNEEKELDALMDHAAAGGLAFYLISDPELRRCYIVHQPEHFQLLKADRPVRLRNDLDAAVHPGMAVVPCIEYSSDEDYLRARLAPARDLWPWPRLLLPTLYEEAAR